MTHTVNDSLPSGTKTGGVFALGNFDGVHRGHRVVLDAAVAQARAMGQPARVLTFEPHPRLMFDPDQEQFRLTPAAAKERLLRAAGIDDIVVVPFIREFAEISAQAFVEDILIKQLGARHVVAGHDFIFGRARGGDMARMRAWLAAHGVGVTEIVAQATGEGAVYSSTRARMALRRGDCAAAAEILGRPWSIAGEIVHGNQRGRTIGTPTANVMLGDYLRPLFGVYAVRAGRVGEGLPYKGVANIGLRPTVDGKAELLETHIFDFDADIYGQEWEFALERFIRPEAKFVDFAALKVQIDKDKDEARRILG